MGTTTQTVMDGGLKTEAVQVGTLTKSKQSAARVADRSNGLLVTEAISPEGNTGEGIESDDDKDTSEAPTEAGAETSTGAGANGNETVDSTGAGDGATHAEKEQEMQQRKRRFEARTDEEKQRMMMSAEEMMQHDLDAAAEVEQQGLNAAAKEMMQRDLNTATEVEAGGRSGIHGWNADKRWKAEEAAQHPQVLQEEADGTRDEVAGEGGWTEVTGAAAGEHMLEGRKDVHTGAEHDGRQSHAVVKIVTKGFPYDSDTTAEGTDEAVDAGKKHLRSPIEQKVEASKLSVWRRQQIIDATGGSSRLRGTDIAGLINMQEEEFIQRVQEMAATRHKREFEREKARKAKRENTDISTLAWLSKEVRGLCKRMSILLQYVDCNKTVVGQTQKNK